MILAAAGVLDGYRATCHWAFRNQLAALGVEVIPQRVVIDRDRVTGAGVTSGIDFAFALLSLLYDERTAKVTQLMMEYAPKPPFNAGAPETAEAEVMTALMQEGQAFVDAFWKRIFALAFSITPVKVNVCSSFPSKAVR